MSKAAEWLREERRRALGDWVAFCTACGHGRRYFAADEAALPGRCPDCGGELRARCGACGSRIVSMFAVECERCEAPLRSPEALGQPIRRAQRDRRGS